MKHSLRDLKYILCMLLALLLLAGAASAQQVARFHFTYGEAALQLFNEGAPNAIAFNGNTYVFSDDRCSFSEALPMYGGKTLSVYEYTVPETNIAAFKEPEDRYLGLLSIVPPENGEIELYVCIGDRNTGVYTVADAAKYSMPYMENVHAQLNAYDTLEIIDRIYLFSYEQNGEMVYSAISLYVDYENYNGAIPDMVAAANLAAETLPTPEPTEVPATATPEPTEVPATATPEPTEVPATATPEPTEVPATATPEPTEVPATATPEPTEVPATATPEPTEVPATAVPEPTDSPKSDALSLDEIQIDAEMVAVNGQEDQMETVQEDKKLFGWLPALAAALVLLLILLILLLVFKRKKPADDTAKRRRFFRLAEIDEQMRGKKAPAYDDVASLEELCRRFRDFASSQLHLYYSLDMIRCFIASFAASRLIIMQGISGTGKTSLAYAFGKFVQNDAGIIPVQPSWRERSDLLGYFNEFTKRFNETELLARIYEAQYKQDIYISVLDEMNIARVEYYFAEFLSVLEMPNPDEWIVSIVPDHWEMDPVKLENGRLHLPRNMWFIGTANNDDSTFAISDKVYDRAMVLDIDSKAEPFQAKETPALHLNSQRFEALLEDAKRRFRISEENIERIQKLDSYIIKHMRVAFGNRIMNQFYNFVPAYMGCGGEELAGIDYILCKKVLRKLESQNMAYIRDEIDDLCDYLDELFGCGAMKNSIDYLKRLKKMG